jgi:hypothetical protein
MSRHRFFSEPLCLGAVLLAAGLWVGGCRHVSLIGTWSPQDDGGVTNDGGADALALVDHPPADSASPGDGGGPPQLTLLAGDLAEQGLVAGIGPAARFSSANSLASDGARTLFVGDIGAVRRVDVPTGDVTTFVGSSTVGASDGVGAAARFGSFTSVAFVPSPGGAGAGSLLVTDPVNHTVRWVDVATAMVTTIAGTARQYGNADGIGGAALFNVPAEIVSDGAGNAFIADRQNFVIRKLVLATREVTTVAGNGQKGIANGTGLAAGFFDPAHVAVDGKGSLYVAEPFGRVIRRIDLTTFEVTIFTGQAGVYGAADGPRAQALFGQPEQMSPDGKGSLYVCDVFENLVRRVDLSTGDVASVVGQANVPGVVFGPAPAGLLHPWGIAVLPAGGLVIGDDTALLIFH